MVLYFDRNLEVLKTILSCAEKAAKIRKTEERAKTNLLTKQKYSFDSNGKLANCEKKIPPCVRSLSWRRFGRRLCQDSQRPELSGYSSYQSKNFERRKSHH